MIHAARIVLLLLFLPACGPAQDLSRVERVVDGDTFIIEGGERVRLIGVDTPETVHPGKPVEPFGPEASSFTAARLAGKRVRLELDVQERDRYGRLLAYVFLEDGTFLNMELVGMGLAMVLTVPPNVKYVDQFLRKQEEARENRRGIWRE